MAVKSTIIDKKHVVGSQEAKATMEEVFAVGGSTICVVNAFWSSSIDTTLSKSNYVSRSLFHKLSFVWFEILANYQNGIPDKKIYHEKSHASFFIVNIAYYCMKNYFIYNFEQFWTYL